ncbi:MAG: extracellular solute-binding protein [Roseinatronobacter sp.]
MTRFKTMALGATTSLATLMAAQAAQAVEIEYWQYIFDTRVQAMDTLIERFQEQNPGITVRHSTFPLADYRTRLAAAIPAGQGPDVMQLFYGWLDAYVDADLVQPLPTDVFAPEMIEAEFFPMVEAMKRDGAYMALPTAVRSLALFYNNRLMAAAGFDSPPETLEEMVEMARAMTVRDNSGNITQVGITTGMNAQDHHWFREVLTRQHGAEPYLDNYRTVNYATPEGIAAFEFYTGLELNEGVTVSGFMDEPQAAFRAGRAGMHIDGSFRIGALEGTRGLDWGVTALPVSTDGVAANYGSYWINAITQRAQGERKDAAVKFMEFIVSEEAMQLWLDVVGELPARPSVALTEENLGNPVYGPFIEGLESAHTTLFVDETAQRQVLMDAVQRVLLEGMSPAESLTIAQEAEQEIIDRLTAN